ncbi:hypothetical protein T4B_5771 [Trichinella pseudospiralis]|uniref:Uncharacterized protein n=1 Tax=Trichinella pseudospiralis TaxID=6337 RepID=A0A0V1IVP3_TRIPS|nr:hypothetical protein T4B_14839 [Trichinella pseudospiralis]KRZ26774.1 hypothetical protein T4B_5771 [Trichinella pseudospiralis]
MAKDSVATNVSRITPNIAAELAKFSYCSSVMFRHWKKENSRLNWSHFDYILCACFGLVFGNVICCKA